MLEIVFFKHPLKTAHILYIGIFFSRMIYLTILSESWSFLKTLSNIKITMLKCQEMDVYNILKKFYVAGPECSKYSPFSPCINQSSWAELCLRLKTAFWVCGSPSKHKVHRVSIGCPTEGCHGCQRLALRNAGGRIKTWSVCIMLFGRSIHVK